MYVMSFLKKLLLLVIIIIYGNLVYAQTTFEEATLKKVQSLLMDKQHDAVDSILNRYESYPQTELGSFLINFERFSNGLAKIQTYKDVSVIVPYAESGKKVFRYLVNNVNGNNAHLSGSWPILRSCAETFNYLNDSIITEIADFSTRYYSEWHQKDLLSFFTVLHNTYLYYCSNKRWNSAVEVMSRLYNLSIESHDTTIITPMSASFIGYACLRAKDYENAEKWLIDSYKHFQNYDEKNKNRAYCELLGNLAHLYYLYGNYNLAYNHAIESYKMSKSNYGEKSKESLNAICLLADCEMALDKLTESKKHSEEFFEILDLQNMSLVEKETYIIEKSISASSSRIVELYEYLLRCYDKNKNNVNIDSYIFVVSNLSNAYSQLGYVVEADSLLNKAINQLRMKNIQPMRMVDLFHSKGILYQSLDNYEMALNWFMQAKEIYDKEENKEINYATLLSNISMSYVSKGDYVLAKQFAEEAYSVYAVAYGSNYEYSKGAFLILNNLVVIYFYLKELDKAKSLCEEIIKLSDMQHDRNSKSLATLHLSGLYFFEGNYKKAESMLREITKYDQQSNKDCAEMFLLLSKCLQNKADVLSDISQFNNSAMNDISNIFTHFTESERENYWTLKSRNILILNNFASFLFNNPQSNVIAYNSSLFIKPMLLNSSRLLGNIVKESNPSVKENYASMLSLKSALSNKKIQKDSIGVYLERIRLLEKTIVSSIPDFEEKLKAQFKTISDVKGMLSDNDVAIEFILTPQFEIPFDNSELQYCALILTNNFDSPILVTLCSESELDDLFDADESRSQDFVEKLYSIQDDRLYRLLWYNIEHYIPRGCSIYYSPTGYINKINLSAVSDGDMRLQDMYDFHAVSSTAIIQEVKQSKTDEIRNAVLYGDINYYEDVDKMVANSMKYDFFSSESILPTRSLNRNTWNLLPGTKEEIASIEKQLGEKGIHVQTYCQDNANEESFKALNSNVPDIIHIATHGFYYNPFDNNFTSVIFSGLNSYTSKDYSLFHSGLLFAGANNAWTGIALGEAVEDGIMTAYEVSQLDLRGNKLLVLSACDTGLGDIDKIDGVFGLQRGFKKAGVATILMSLWKVPDEETGILMKSFYEHYISGESPRKSLKQAQDVLIQMGKSPYYWAGFVVLD